jgi:hypothetical protein
MLFPPCLDHPNYGRFQTPACVPQSYLAKQLPCTRTAVKANHAPASQAVANANAQAPAARNPDFPLLDSGLHHAMADSIAPVSGAFCALGSVAMPSWPAVSVLEISMRPDLSLWLSPYLGLSVPDLTALAGPAWASPATASISASQLMRSRNLTSKPSFSPLLRALH